VTFYLAAVAAGGTVAAVVATGIILFFHYGAEKRQQAGRAFQARVRRLGLLRSNRRRIGTAPTGATAGKSFQNETVLSD
jgi:hypothetical protein